MIPCIYGQLIFDKGDRQFNGKTMVIPANGTETTGYPHAEELSLPLPHIIHKN